MDIIIPGFSRPKLSSEDVRLSGHDGENLGRTLQDLGVEDSGPFGVDVCHFFKMKLVVCLFICFLGD